MALIKSGLFEDISGSIGDVTYQKHRGQLIARQRPNNRNNNSSSQLAHQLRFKIAVHITRQLTNPIRKLFWDPQFKKQTGFSMLFKSVFDSLDSNNRLTPSSILTTSSVKRSHIHYMDYWPSTGLCDVDYYWDIDGIKSEDDNAYLIVYHKLSHTIWIHKGELPRSFRTIQTTIATGLNPDDILFFLTHDLVNRPDLFCETSHGVQAVNGHFP